VVTLVPFFCQIWEIWRVFIGVLGDGKHRSTVGKNSFYSGLLT
jgi:hypothetical protein